MRLVYSVYAEYKHVLQNPRYASINYQGQRVVGECHVHHTFQLVELHPWNSLSLHVSSEGRKVFLAVLDNSTIAKPYLHPSLN